MRGGRSWQLIFMIFIQSKYIEIQTEVNSLDNDLAMTRCLVSCTEVAQMSQFLKYVKKGK